MKKITKTNFQGLRQLFPVLEKEEMRHYIGGNSGGYYYTGGWNGNGGYYGSPGSGDSSYYSQYDFDNWEGPWYGGWVYGMGWVAPDTDIYGHYPSGGYNYPYWWYYDEPLEHPNWDGDYSGYYPSYYGYNYGYDGYGEGYFTGGGSSSSGNHDSSIDTNKYGEVWQESKSIYYQIALLLGVDLNSVKIELGTGRGANAWRDGNKIIIGYQFFENLSNEYDRTAVLIHEMKHIEYDDPNVEIKKIPVSGVLANQETVPSFVKEYIDKIIERTGGVTSFGYDYDFETYVDYSELSSPIYYENELRAYEHEIEVCSDSLVTPEYALERRYKVWRYEQLLQKARENSELNP